MTIAFHGPAFSDTAKDYAAMDLLLDLYFGETSDTYKRLVEQEQKVDALFSDNEGHVDPSLTGVYARLKKMDDALSVRDVRYSDITTTAAESENVYCQHVRLLDETINNNQANCVDGTVVFASILRKIGISPLMVLIPGHCFLGYYTDKTKKNVAFLETTLLSNTLYLDKAKTPAEKTKAYIEQFNLALASGMDTYKKQSLKDVRLIDVDKYRAYVKPIPF